MRMLLLNMTLMIKQLHLHLITSKSADNRKAECVKVHKRDTQASYMHSWHWVIGKADLQNIFK